MATENTWVHAPTEKLDYTWPWSDWLPPGDHVKTYTLTPQSGVTKVTEGMASDDVTAVLAVDPALPFGTERTVLCHIVTIAGLEADATLTLVIGRK